MRLIFTLLLFFSMLAAAFGGTVKGTVTDTTGAAIPFVSVYVKNTTYGVAANENGKYFIELKDGDYTLVFSAVGYRSMEKHLSISGNEGMVLNMVLPEPLLQMKEVVISKKAGNRGKEIMKMVREKRSFYLDQLQSYSCQTYQKISIERESLEKPKDSVKIKDAAGQEVDLKTRTRKKKESVKLVESLSTIYFQAPSRYREDILAYHDFVDKKPSNSQGFAIGMQLGENDITPQAAETQNPDMIPFDPSQADFNFYRNILPAPQLCSKPLQSPLAEGAELNYNYELEASFYEDGKKIYKIKVMPVSQADALYSGTLFIEDSTWAIRSLDLSINPASLLVCKDFHIIQNYTELPDEVYVVKRREFSYTISQGETHVLGNCRVDHSGYEVNKPFAAKIFTPEIKHYTADAFDKDSTYWGKMRPLTLTDKELNYIIQTDSLNHLYEGKEYLDSLDSAFNHLNIWNFVLNGIYHRDREHSIDYYIDPLIAQLNPVGIGGYRHKLGGTFDKEFNNGQKLETRGQIDYGFRNRDVKGKLGVGYTYLPKKFMRTFVDVGDYYELINSYTSLATIFSRSNFVRTRTFSIAQRMEIINGLFGELTFDFSDQDPLTNLQLEPWAKYIFGDYNKPTDFTRYKKAEIRLEMTYRIGQKFMIKNGKKIIFGDNYPEITLLYRKGIPGLLKSEVNFDYIQLGAHHDMRLARLGTSSLDVRAGSFINTANLRFLEYCFFRGSDKYYFSDPLLSFQLLGPTLSTNTAFFRANYIHHFDGFLTDKLPGNKWLRLSLAGGAGVLMIPSQHMSHAEILGGIERIIKLWRQPFRLGVYAVTADNTIAGADWTIKFGINFYDSYLKKWQY